MIPCVNSFNLDEEGDEDDADYSDDVNTLTQTEGDDDEED